MKETKDLISRTITQNQNLIRRVDELEFILHKSHRQNLLLSGLETRMEEMEEKLAGSITSNASNFDQIKFQHSVYTDKLQTLQQQQMVSIVPLSLIFLNLSNFCVIEQSELH